MLFTVPITGDPAGNREKDGGFDGRGDAQVWTSDPFCLRRYGTGAIEGTMTWQRSAWGPARGNVARTRGIAMMERPDDRSAGGIGSRMSRRAALGRAAGASIAFA